MKQAKDFFGDVSTLSRKQFRNWRKAEDMNAAYEPKLCTTFYKFDIISFNESDLQKMSLLQSKQATQITILKLAEFDYLLTKNLSV